jgi:HD-like signal output (HDOD) protein
MTEPATETDQEDIATAQQLLADLSKVRDFPALSQVIAKVNHIASADNSRTDELTESILKDVSLTNKLLRVVNSVNYKQLGAGPVNTVSRAIIILGYDTVRDAALSLMLFDHLANHAQADELKGEAVESFYCGILGRAMAGRAGVRDREEVLICSLFRNLGRMMCRLHFYEKSKQVEQLVVEQGLTEAVASRRIFGISYDDFGLALGHHWRLPASLLQGMSPLPASSEKKVGNDVPKLQVLANLAHDLYRAARDSAPDNAMEAYADLLKRYGASVPLQTADLEELVYQAGAIMEKEAITLQVDVRSSPLLVRLLSHKEEDDSEAAAEAEELALIEAASVAETGTETETQEQSLDPTSILITGMQDLTSMLLEDSNPADVLHVAAELLYRARCFDNVLISTIAANGQELVGRIGLGPQAELNKTGFRIPLAFAPDVFHVAVSKNADLLIADTQADSIRSRVPVWYTNKFGARSFLLLPIVLNNRTVAVLYGDKHDVTLQLSQQTLGLIKALRNQITLALRQKNA